MEGRQKVHFVGIGGIGMSALARILMSRGDLVSGSDLKLSPLTEALVAQGAVVFQGHAASNLEDVDLVVITAAAANDNPEIVEARRRGIPVIKRAELLARMMSENVGVAVAGTHGKTTTSSLLAMLLERAGLDPTIVVGGEMIDYGTNAIAGHGRYLVAEADEFDASFLCLLPYLAVVLNVEAEHLDCYGTYEGVVQAFAQFMDNVQPEGLIVACADDPGVEYALARMARPVARHRIQDDDHPRLITYGLWSEANWQVTDIRPNSRGGHDFVVALDGRVLGVFSNRLPGYHNVANSLAAIAAANNLGVELMSIRQTLAQFQGTKRRFEVHEVDDITIVDDYGHHPSEIRVVLQAARQRFGDRRLICVFQPHTYSRVKHLFEEFVTCFALADVVVVTDIYAAREHDTLGMSGEGLAKAISRPEALYIPDLTGVTEYALRTLAPGDVLLTIGAGDVTKVAQMVSEGLAVHHGQD